MLGACATVDNAVDKDTGTIDVTALEQFGTKIEKYNFAPHRAVLDTSGKFIGTGHNVFGSLQDSCKKASGIFSYAQRGSSVDKSLSGTGGPHTAFSEIFWYLGGNTEKISSEARCELPGRGVIEITDIREGIYSPFKYFIVIQDDSDIKATESLISHAINDWKHTSETLRNNLSPGTTVYLVSRVSNKRWSETEGLVIEVKQPLVLVQSQKNSQQWVKIEDVNAKVPDILFCSKKEINIKESRQYANRQYEDSCFQRQ